MRPLTASRDRVPGRQVGIETVDRATSTCDDQCLRTWWPPPPPQHSFLFGRRSSGARRQPATLRSPGQCCQETGRGGGGGCGGSLRERGHPGTRTPLGAARTPSGSGARNRHCSVSDDFISRVSEPPGRQKEDRSAGRQSPPCLFRAGPSRPAAITLARSDFNPALSFAFSPSREF